MKYIKSPWKRATLQREYGTERTNGEYVSFVDSDDYTRPLLLDFAAKKMVKRINDSLGK